MRDRDQLSARLDVITEMTAHATTLVQHGGANLEEIRRRFHEAGLVDEELRFAMTQVEGRTANVAAARKKLWMQQVAVWLGAIAMVGVVLLVMWLVEFR